ncbi:MAG: hypothetical protein CBD97_01775 [Pelagibacteraceae bacterium TMED237]|nr:MAG: hypothetical protein CBD97_01775 [Pelagibacteraceae bacterium TMED237]|tara:strand:- start:1345 stop:3075 length:1731 start_codon:yes stop_codon:yes gene_type:complete
MDLDILGVINKNFFSLSNYRLSVQLLVVNIFIVFFGTIFLLLFNYYLINNDRLIEYKSNEFKNELKDITAYLQNNSVIRIPLFQTNYRCRIIDKNIDAKLYKDENCNEENLNSLELSDLELEKFITEQYIIQNYIEKAFNVKIFNDNWIKIADSENLYLQDEVNETEIVDILPKKLNIFELYEENYHNFFNSIYSYLLNKKFIEISNKKTHDINIVSETIRKKEVLEKLYINRDNKIIKTLSSPIMLDQKVYGVALLSYQLITDNNELSINSINLLNFFIVLIIIIIILSFFFLRGLIIPLNQLTKITVLEREKIRNTKNINYPSRGDEIGILAQQIQIMSRDLKSQMEQLEKFTTDVAHELKNPLTAIKSSSELLLKNTISEENKLKVIKTFNKEVNRMNRLISDISNFSRTMTEIEIEKFKLIDLNKFLQDFKKNYLGNSKNINLILDTENNDFKVLLNEDKLIQVILNLIENSVSVADKNSKILIKTSGLANFNVEIKIYDQGKGINFNDKEKIFNRFYTDRDEFREDHSGLGLSISREIIKSFNGSIKLTKSDNFDFGGACFIIKLPLRITM